MKGTANTGRPPADDLAARVSKLEEAQTFGERGVEQLSAEIALLNRRLGEVQAQFRRLEARLNARARDATDGPAGDDPA